MTREELARVISETKRELHDDDDDDDDSNEENDNMEMDEDGENAAPSGNGRRNAGDDEYDFDNYDNENATNVAHISDVAEMNDQDESVEDVEDSEDEDDRIKPTDNLILAGHVDDDAASLEVFSMQFSWLFELKF